MKKLFLLLLLSAGILASCSKDDSPTPNLEGDVKMIVVNEGGMGNGFGALTAITYDGTSKEDIFRDVNGRPMGDVAQSITCINGKYFVTMNNSRKIEVVEPKTFKSLGTITYEKDGKPRFVVAISEDQAIVSDLNSQLVRIDINNYQVLEYIDITPIGAGSLEKMIRIGNKIFCAGDHAVVVFDVNNVTKEGARTIDLGESIMKTAKPILDKNGKLWMMTYQEIPDNYESVAQITLHCINPDTETVERTVAPQAAATTAENIGKMVGFPQYNRMDTDRSRSKIYVPFNQMVAYSDWSGTATTYLAIYTLDVDKDAFDVEPFRQLPGLGMMYGMGIDPDGQSVYICDCLDYSRQRGYLREYKADGQETSYRVGIYPRMVYFTEYDN